MEISKDPRYVRCRICGGDTFQASGNANWKMCDQCESFVCPRCYRNELKKASNCTEHEPSGQWLTSVADSSRTVLFK